MDEVPFVVTIFFPLGLIKAKFLVWIPLDEANESEARGLVALHLAELDDIDGYSPSAGEYLEAVPLQDGRIVRIL